MIRALFAVVAAIVVGSLLPVTSAHAVEGRTPTPDFVIVVVPDTQNAVERYPEVVEAQGAYLAELKPNLILHVGDIVNQVSNPDQWATFSDAFVGIDSPTVFAAGNHDMEDYTVGTKPYPTIMDPFAEFNSANRVDGAFDALNFYRLVGDNYLVMSLQFGAPDIVLSWAKKVAQSNPNRTVILITHDYLNQKSQVRGAPGNGYELSLPKSFNTALNNPYRIWTRFVSQVSNVKFVFSGHVTTKTSGLPYAVGYKVSKNVAGKYVYQMMANYQSYGQGGDGFLRVIRLSPVKGTFKVQTFSPYLGTYLTGWRDTFTVENVTLRGM